MTTGERIKHKREQLGMSQEELAKKLGYASRSSVNKLELSREIPSRLIQKCAIALGTTPAYLMGWEEKRPVRPILSNFDDDELDFEFLKTKSPIEYVVNINDKCSLTIETDDFTTEELIQISDFVKLAGQQILNNRKDKK